MHHKPAASKIQTFYSALADSMKDHHFRFIWSKLDQNKFDIPKTIFIPFDAEDKEDKNGYGLYLFVHEIKNPKKVSHCIVAAATLKLENTHHKKELSQLLHEINLVLPVPGWILNDRENLLHFKYIFSGTESEKVPETYLTLIAEIINGIAKSFPLLKDAIEGRPFEEIRDSVAARLSS